MYVIQYKETKLPQCKCYNGIKLDWIKERHKETLALPINVV
jgi:hypothetical protein